MDGRQQFGHIEARDLDRPVINICPAANSTLSITNPVGAMASRKPFPSMAISSFGELACINALAPKVSQSPGLTPHDLATGIERMLGAGVTQAEIARALGRSKQFVSLYAACADMAPWLRAAIDQMPIRLLYDLHRAARGG